jgi:hypothetical protein
LILPLTCGDGPVVEEGVDLFGGFVRFVLVAGFTLDAAPDEELLGCVLTCHGPATFHR